jgi:pimeloyl-ACP methyl ester carboxylesterase
LSETIFMIHCMGGGPWTWDHYARFLRARGHTCIATTLRYHDTDPEAPPDPRLGTMSLRDFVSDLEAELRELPSDTVIVGHSLGGFLAQALAARRFGKAVVLLAPAAPAGINAIRPTTLKAFWSIQTQWGFWRKPVRQTFAEVAATVLNRLPPSQQRSTYERFVYESGRAVAELGYWFLDPRHASRVEADRAVPPMLVLVGTEDRITPPALVRRVARKYRPQATLRELSDHGHWLVAEPGWPIIAEQVAEWIEGQTSHSILEA